MMQLITWNFIVYLFLTRITWYVFGGDKEIGSILGTLVGILAMIKAWEWFFEDFIPAVLDFFDGVYNAVLDFGDKVFDFVARIFSR